MVNNKVISIIICTYNRARFLPLALADWYRQDAPKELYELIIINNNSPDTTESICLEFIHQHPDYPIKYFVETQQGLSYARNRGIQEASGLYCCFVDDDGLPATDYVTVLYNYIQLHPLIAGIGGRVDPYYIDGEPNWMSPFLEPLVAKFNAGDQVLILEKNIYPFGCNMCYKTELLRHIGGFDVALGRMGNSGDAGEEKDVFKKIRKQGGQVIYLPILIVKHIIEAQRLSPEYIHKLGIGLGKSEHTRLHKDGRMALYKKQLELLIKWIGAYVLACYYFIRQEPAKANMLILFRNAVNSGWRTWKSTKK